MNRGQLLIKDVLFRHVCSAMIFGFIRYFGQGMENIRSQCGEYKLKLKKKSEKLSIKNRFIATVTHEIRNFVTVYDAFFHVLCCGSL